MKKRSTNPLVRKVYDFCRAQGICVICHRERTVNLSPHCRKCYDRNVEFSRLRRLANRGKK